MKRLVTAVVSALTGMAALGATLQWDPTGSGGWGDASRYIERKEPAAGDIVQVNGGSVAPLNDSDWDAVKDLKRIYMPDNTSRVVLNLSENYAWNGEVYGKGSFTKLGAGTFTVKGMVSFSGCIAVTNGQLAVEKIADTLANKTWPLVSVANGAVFTIAGTSHGAETFFSGVCGEGTVSNLLHYSGFKIMGPNAPTLNPPEYVFDGHFGGWANVGIGGGGGNVGDYKRYGGSCRQWITQAQTGFNVRNGFKFCYGDLWVPSIGDGTDANPGSLGVSYVPVAGELGGTLCFDGFTNMTATLHYAGAGERVKWRKFAFRNNYIGSQVSIDAGAATSLEFANAWRYDPGKFGLKDGVMGRVFLDGSNVAACVVSGTFEETKAGAGFSFVKRGTGIWRFTDNARGNSGPILVERGALEFDGIAEAGVQSALGTASLLSTNFYGSAADCSVPWAFRLGDGSTDWASEGLATLRYSGPTGNVAASCSSRPIAVRGAARLADGGGGSIHLKGVFSDQPGVNALVLDGTGDDSLVNVTNGTGTLRIVKEGAGSWTLGGDLDFNGGIDVRSGVLRLATASSKYAWYRLNIKEINYDYSQHADWGAYAHLRQVALWNEDGLVNENLSHNLEADGNPISIGVGEYAVVRRNWQGSAASSLRNDASVMTYRWFTTAEDASYFSIGGVKPTFDKPDSWIGVVMRPTVKGASATRYDLRAWSSEYANSAKSWTLEGSTDGLVWTELHSVVSNANVFSTTKCWYTSTSYSGSWNAESVPGYELPTTASYVPRRAASFGVVSVAAGATLAFESAQGIDALSCDAALGCGKIQGASFAQTGSLTVVGGEWTNGRMALGYDLAGCSGLENISNWSVNVDGSRCICAAAATEHGIVLMKLGCIMIVR